MRRRHPKLGIIEPKQFIPFAEKADLMKPLTLFLLKEAVNQCRLWHESGLKISVAMNLVRESLLDSDLPDPIFRLLEISGVDPAWLDAEITESIIMSGQNKIANAIVQIARKGIALSLDNFGFLSSSMNCLTKFPIHSIKIDRSYVMDAILSSDHAMVVKSAIDFAHGQGLKVIAVGVEDQETLDQLVAFDCDEAQGYFISRPVPAEEIGVF